MYGDSFGIADGWEAFNMTSCIQKYVTTLVRVEPSQSLLFLFSAFLSVCRFVPS